MRDRYRGPSAAVRQRPGGTLTSSADRLDVAKGDLPRLAGDLETAGWSSLAATDAGC